MFISREDLNMNLYAPIIDAITELDGNRETYGIRAAEATVSAYLSGRYDVDYLFSQTGDDRNFLVVDICANIALYHIADVLEAMPVTIINPYEKSMDLLKDLQSGKAMLPGVPEPTDPETGERDTYIRYGEITKNRY